MERKNWLFCVIWVCVIKTVVTINTTSTTSLSSPTLTLQTKTPTVHLPSTTPKTVLFTSTKSTLRSPTSMPSFASTTGKGICGNDGFISSSYYQDYYHNWHIGYSNTTWYNMSFWGGHVQIPWKDNLDDSCEFHEWNYFLALSEKHKHIGDIGEDIVTVDAVIRNHTDDQNKVNVKVEMKTCNGDLLYRFPWVDNGYYDYSLSWNTYICFDIEYKDTCGAPDSVYTAGVVKNGMLGTFENNIQLGWLDAYRDGKQYVLPSFDDVADVFEKCADVLNYREGYFLREQMPENIGDVPIRLQLCLVWNYAYYDYDDDYHYDENCGQYAFARECSGKIQFDLSYFQNWAYPYLCLVHYNNVKVIPEIRHVKGDDNRYNPYLQFRCSFEMVGSYIVKWYINGGLWVETGPSSEPDDLVFTGEELNNLKLGYEVRCGVIATNPTQSNETFSDDFYAGWKVADTKIRLSKNGHAFVDVEQTVPLGCAYTETEQEHCEEILSLVDPLHGDSMCTAGIRVLNANDAGKSYHKVKSQKVAEKWTENQKYSFRLTTIDKDYDDKLYFDLQLLVSKTSGQTPGKDVSNLELINTVEVVVTQSDRHRNKRCYSHVDPHMRTADGKYYEQQREGDHMLYRNLAFQTEVHESAKFCSGSSGPVCACGVAVRSGADVFMVNRCGSYTYLDFLQCGDGGILDVERVHDYHYKVTTPIGTIVDIALNSWGKTLNIDIYLSAKDFNNTDGLCGYFDGDRNNDFRHRDGTSSNGNSDYAFSNSWRLSDEENFFMNGSRKLEHWNESNIGSPERPCSKPNSITRNKCNFEKRKRREDTVQLGIKSKKTGSLSNPEFIREKRSAGTEMTEDEARVLCNRSIFESPAYREFPDQLAEEDPEAVISQCVFDIVQGNDTVWAEAHVNALNNVAAAVLDLSPVYAANNSESIKSFLSQTCLNNCSGNGECLDTGMCSCGGIFRGPDCGIDLRIPPVIYDIQGGDVCDTKNGDDCTCFDIRTNSIFEGFMYEISTFKIYFNGTKKSVDQSIHDGEYEDIFTGVCCVHARRKRRNIDDTAVSIVSHSLTLSNDGINYGTSRSVFVYDSTCLNLVFSSTGDIVSVELKEGYCYIGDICIRQDSALQTQNGCFVCNPDGDLYAWSKVSCKSDKQIGLTTGALSGIIAGSVLAGVIITVVIVYIRCCKGMKKRRAVDDVNSSRTYLTPAPMRTA